MTDLERVVRLTVLGVPAPQGSKVRTKWGMREDNPNTKPWRQAVASEALEHCLHEIPFPTGPVTVNVHLYFPRPKSHYRTGRNSHLLKPSAPRWHTTKPDADKLMRALGDAMSGIVFRDDSQIAALNVAKHYGSPARAEIGVAALGDVLNEHELAREVAA